MCQDTSYSKNAIGWLLSVLTPAEGADANYTYDSLGRLYTAVLTRGTDTQTRMFTYDALGQLRQSVQPETHTWTFDHYGALGNLLQYTDGASQAFQNTYDLKGRLTDLGQTSPASFPLTHNTYDGGGAISRGKLTQSVQYQRDAAVPTTIQNVTLSFAYRALDGLLGTLSQTTTAHGFTTAPVFSYTLSYDNQKQVVGQQISPLGETISTAYLHGAMSSRVLDTLGRIGSMSYNPAGALVSETFANGYKEAVAYDTYNRPSGYQLQVGTTPIWRNGSYANAATPYAYDGAGNIKSIGNMNAPASPDTFFYDRVLRLTKATVGQGTYGHTYNYTYDPFGNLHNRTESVPQGFTSLSAYIASTGASGPAADAYIKAVCFTATVGTDEKGVEPDNRLAQVTRGGTITIGGGLGTPGMETPTGIPVSMAAPDYDGNGNLTADDTFTYAYDPLNRLVAVRVKSTTLLVAQYYYDAAGERTGVKAYNAGGTAMTFMQTLRNGSDALYEKTWDLPGGAVNTEKVYLMAGGRMAVTRQKAYGLTTTYTYYGTDHLGTVRSTVVLNSAGQAQPTTFHDYEPFGVEIPGDTVYTSPNTHRYTGQERDGLYNPATGTTDYLDYMHFRFYGSNIGRFMKPDNISGNMLNPQSWNLYSYVHGNPVNLNDPTGHQTASPWSNDPDQLKKQLDQSHAQGSIPGGVSAEYSGASDTAQKPNINVPVNLVYDANMPEGDRAKVTARFETEAELALLLEFGPIGITFDFSFTGQASTGYQVNLDYNVFRKGGLNVFFTNVRVAGHDANFKYVTKTKTGVVFVTPWASASEVVHEFLHAFGLRVENPYLDWALHCGVYGAHRLLLRANPTLYDLVTQGGVDSIRSSALGYAQ